MVLNKIHSIMWWILWWELMEQIQKCQTVICIEITIMIFWLFVILIIRLSINWICLWIERNTIAGMNIMLGIWGLESKLNLLLSNRPPLLMSIGNSWGWSTSKMRWEDRLWKKKKKGRENRLKWPNNNCSRKSWKDYSLN